MFKNIIAVAIIAAFSSAAFAEATPTAPAKPVEAAKTVAATPAPAAAEAAKPQVKPEEAKEAAKVEKKAKHKVKKAVEAPAAATTEAAPAAAKPATTAVIIPFSGDTPDATANAIAKGNATIPTIIPAKMSFDKFLVSRPFLNRLHVFGRKIGSIGVNF